MKKLLLLLFVGLSSVAMDEVIEEFVTSPSDIASALFYVDIDALLCTARANNYSCSQGLCWWSSWIPGRCMSGQPCEHLGQTIENMATGEMSKKAMDIRFKMEGIQEVNHGGKSYPYQSDRANKVFKKIAKLARQYMIVEFDTDAKPYDETFERVSLSQEDQAYLETIFSLIGERYSSKLREIIDRDAKKDEAQD